MRRFNMCTKKDLKELQDRMFDKCSKILVDKNDDYSTREETGVDSLSNFRIIEHTYGLVPAEVGVFVRLNDKLSRISSFLKTGVFSVADEKLEDTICDAINYLVLLNAVIKSYRHDSPVSPEVVNVAEKEVK